MWPKDTVFKPITWYAKSRTTKSIPGLYMWWQTQKYYYQSLTLGEMTKISAKLTSKQCANGVNSSQFLKNLSARHTIPWKNQFWTWNYCLVLCGSDCQFTILLYVCEIRDKSLICHILKRIAARDLMSRNFSLVLWTLKLFVSFGTLQFNMNCL